MFSFKTKKDLELAFKNAKFCEISKTDEEFISQEIQETLNSFEKEKEKILYLETQLVLKFEELTCIITSLYPHLTFNKGIEKLYDEIKIIEEKYKDIEDNKVFVKNIKIRKNPSLKEAIMELGLNGHLLAKAAYIKKIIAASKECDVFN